MNRVSRAAGPLSNRRMVLAGAAALLLPWPVLPAWAARDGFVIDWQGGPQTPAIAASLESQIKLVEALPVSAAAMAFFRAEVIHVDVEEGTRTRANRGVFFAREVSPPDNPVLLHELIHRWQLMRMPGGRANPDVHRFYNAAKASGNFPAQSYMLSNAFEFFAMCASVVLHGRAARPPFVRARVKETMPELYAFIVKEFGLQGA